MVEQWPVRPMVLSSILSLSAACSFSAPDIPSVDGVYEHHECGLTKTGLDCYGGSRASECQALGLDQYGVDDGCKALMVEMCEYRAQGTLYCSKHGDLLCCPK